MAVFSSCCKGKRKQPKFVWVYTQIQGTNCFFELDLVDFDAAHSVSELLVVDKLISILHILTLAIEIPVQFWSSQTTTALNLGCFDEYSATSSLFTQ